MANTYIHSLLCIFGRPWHPVVDSETMRHHLRASWMIFHATEKRNYIGHLWCITSKAPQPLCWGGQLCASQYLTAQVLSDGASPGPRHCASHFLFWGFSVAAALKVHRNPVLWKQNLGVLGNLMPVRQTSTTGRSEVINPFSFCLLCGQLWDAFCKGSSESPSSLSTSPRVVATSIVHPALAFPPFLFRCPYPYSYSLWENHIL